MQEFNQNGMISKTKERRLLLLNDLLVCVSVASKSGDDFRHSERLTLKWAFPITEIEVHPILSSLVFSSLNLSSVKLFRAYLNDLKTSRAESNKCFTVIEKVLKEYEVSLVLISP